MRLMLDTHAFIWLDEAPEKLSDKARAACMDRTNTLHLSLASIWEMQIKIQIGKLSLKGSLDELIRRHQMANGLILETIDLPDILFLNTLPPQHRDPFDRMIIAQTLQRGFHVVTVDSAFAAYQVPVLW
jgi:PIN domain nuclease of toxin-antitoxin system